MACIFRQEGAWHIRFYFRGRPYRKSLGSISEHKALRAKQRVEARIADLKGGFLKLPDNVDLAEYIVRGETVPLPDAASISASFRSAKLEYLEYARPRRAPSSLVTEQIHLRHFEQFLGERASLPISEVTTADVERYLTERRREVTGTTANKELQTLRQLFDFAVKREDTDSNPTYDATRFKGAGRPHRFVTKAEIDGELRRGEVPDDELMALRRFRYLGKEEVAGLLDLATKRDPWLHPILATLAFTGMRRGEVVALEWGDVDFEGRRIWVRSRKQSRNREFTARDVDLHEKLRGILLRHRDVGLKGRCVFRSRDGGPLTPYDLHQRFKKLIEGSDYEGIGLHCLRHSFASNLAAQGVDGRLIDHYMGQQTQEMRQRYQHLFPEKSEGIQKLPY